MQAEFFHANPRQPALERIAEILAQSDGTTMIAMCFISRMGTGLLMEHQNAFIKDESFVAVTARAPTDISAMIELGDKMPGKVWYHNVSGSTFDSENGVPAGVLHDKIIYTENDDQATLWVGSHNLTRNGVTGINIESAIILSGSKDEVPFSHARKHLQKIKKECTDVPPTTPKAPIRKELTLDRPVVIVECTASPAVQVAMKGRADYYFTIHLRHEDYDRICIPPKNAEKQVRLLVYNPGDLTSEGPKVDPQFIRMGEIHGINFTAKNRRKGRTVRWRDISYCIEERPFKKKYGPLHVVKRRRFKKDEYTVCAVRIENSSDYSADTEIILPSPLKKASKTKSRKIYLHDPNKPQFDLFDEGAHGLTPGDDTPYIELTESTKPVLHIKTNGAFATSAIRVIRAMAEKQNLEVREERRKGSYKFISGGYVYKEELG
jgi:hypothetical protein